MGSVICTADVDTIRDLGGSLLEEHWREVALHKGLMKLAPDWRKYYAMEEQGGLLVLAVFAHEKPEAPELIGYSVTFVHAHPHYSGLKVAQNDVLFIEQEARKSGVGVRLIKETERHAKEHGAQMVMWHAKKGTALESLLPRLGYGVQDIMFSKEL